MFAIEYLSAASIGSFDEPSAWTLSDIRSESREAAEEEARSLNIDADGEWVHRVRWIEDDEDRAEVVQIERYFEPAKAWVPLTAVIKRGVRFVR